ncbi:MAG: 3-phosphoshikimate 1-carboxyvinyltransferase [Lysobacterales bacterium]
MSAEPARIDWRVRAGGALCGELHVPGDKSVSHRAVMLASIAEGTTRIDNFLEGADTQATASICTQLGASIETPAYGIRVVSGRGREGLEASAAPLDCGNAGTAMRLLTGLLAGQSFDSELVGDASLSRRPMARVIEPLHAMGARITAQPNGLAPLRIHGGRALNGIDYATPVASAQIKSAVLLAALYARGATQVTESRPTREYTESLLRHFGYPIEFGPGRVRLEGGGRLGARDVVVPGDFSSAAFWLVAATVMAGSKLIIDGVGVNPRRLGLWQALTAMGANLAIGGASEGIEPTARLTVNAAPLHGIRVKLEWVPDMIDEMPALFVAAALADGETWIEGAGELRVKESDRIAVMATALRAMGADLEERPDGALIRGVESLRGAEVDAAGDHRCAMALAVAALRADDDVLIRDCANVATSYPDFAGQLRRLGASVDVIQSPHQLTSLN